MSTYRLTADIAAPVDQVFDLWSNPERWREWIEGMTRVTDVSGPPGTAGTRYTTWFGNMRSATEILEAERPRSLRTRFGNRMLRGETRVAFDSTPSGTRLTQEFRTEGLVPAISGWIFAHGSYRGSFRGELNTFVRIVEREAGTNE